MDVEAKISCSLDDLIKLQRRGGGGGFDRRGPQRAAVTPLRSSPRSRGTAPFKAPAYTLRRQQQAPHPVKSQQGRGELNWPRKSGGARPLQQRETKGVVAGGGARSTFLDRLNQPLDALIPPRPNANSKNKQQQREQQQQQQQERQQQQQRALARRRGGIVVPRRLFRHRGRIGAAALAAAAFRGAATNEGPALPRGKGLLSDAAVRTRKANEFLKASAGPVRKAPPAAALPRRRAFVRASERARVHAGAAGRPGSGGSSLSLARRGRSDRGAFSTSGSLRLEKATPPPLRAGGAVLFAATSRVSEEPLLAQTSAPGLAVPVDAEMLSNIKIMAALDSVPAPLPQQRGTLVAIPAAMQQEQARAAGNSPGVRAAEAGGASALGSRFGY